MDTFVKSYCFAVYSTKSGEPESHLFMTEQSLRLAHLTGYCGFVTPNTWLTQARGKSLRKFILEKAEVRSIVHLRKEVFDDVPDVVPIEFTIACHKSNPFVQVAIAYPDPAPPNDIISGQYWKQHEISQALWAQHAKFNFNIFRSDTVNALCSKIEEASDNLEIGFEAIYGIRTGENERFLKSNRTHNRELPCLVSASEISRYEVKWDGVYIDPDGLLSQGKMQQLSSPKIVVQYTRKLSMPIRIVASLDSDGTFVPLNRFSYVIARQDQPSLMYLMALLSSSVLNFYHANTFIDYDIKPTYLQEEPIHLISFNTDLARRAELKEAAKTHYERSMSEGHDPVLAFTAERIERGETDVVHDLLAFLAEMMIDLNQQKQAEVKRFLGWLENTLQIAPKSGETGIDSLPGKTIIQGYLGDYQKGEAEADFDAVYDKLFANRRRFRVSLPDVKPRIEDEYQRSLAVLLPIKRQLEHTDTLIDRIVYQLYGLTDEEIRLIEGPQYEQAVAKAKEAVLRDEAFKDHDDEALSAIGDLIQPAAQRLDTVLPPLSAEASLDQDFPTWRGLPERARNALRSAERQFLESDETEFTGSVVNYAKAVEISLNELLFTPFRAAGYTDRDVENEMAFKPFMRGQRKGIMLGSMDYVLSSKERAFHSFVLTLYPDADNSIFSKTALRSLLTPDQIERRNRAAHDDAMSRQDAEDARNWALSLLQYL